MKKTYINPEIEVVRMKMNQHLLDGSPIPMGSGDKDPGTEADGHEDDFDW